MTEIRVVVAWATPAHQELVPVTLTAGATVERAIDASGLTTRYSIDLRAMRVGINGRLARLDAPVTDGDRIEIYRPLIADPKTVRRARAGAKRIRQR